MRSERCFSKKESGGKATAACTWNPKILPLSTWLNKVLSDIYDIPSYLSEVEPGNDIAEGIKEDYAGKI